MKLPDMNMQAQTAYGAWVQRQEGDDERAWADLPATEQDAWRRAVRLIHLLGLEDG